MSDTIYIIEGPDGSGKSTLAHLIGKKKNISVHHLTYYKEKDKMSMQFAEAHSTFSLFETPVIFDRYIFSNIAYGCVFHGCEFVNGWQLWLDSLLTACTVRKNIHIVFCLPEKKSWLERFEKLCKEREEMYLDVEKMSKIYDMFEMMYLMISNTPYIKITRIDPFVMDKESTLELLA